MKIDQELGSFSPEGESVLTIGVFDGVHQGHRHLMSRLSAEAARTGRLAGVVTFRNHPASVLGQNFKPRYLTSVEERLRLITELGVDFVVPLTFDVELSRLSAEACAGLLQRHLAMKGLVVGPDFAMGHNREGDVEKLTALGREMGFSVTLVDPLLDGDGAPIRSTSVREALSRGDATRVNSLLGRNFILTGTVVTGAGRGGNLGFPTANLKLPEGIASMADGIYATWAYVNARRYMAATSIGIRPTFEGSEHAVEAFILEFEGDLYGQEVRLEFVRRLRDELRFETAGELQEQVGKDVDETRAILGSLTVDSR